MRLYANCVDISVPMTGRGLKKNVLISRASLEFCHAIVYSAGNAGMNKMPDRKHVIQQMKLCLNGSAYTYMRYDHLYDRIMRTFSDQVDVSGDN